MGNLGEDLMENLLTLDSLSNLTNEDRMMRKKTVNEIEGLLSTVDTAKAELSIFCGKLEAELPEKESDRDSGLPVPSGWAGNGIGAEETSQVAEPVQQTPEKAKKPRRMTEKNEFARMTVEVPSRQLWEQVDLAVQFAPREERHRYVIEAHVPEIDRKELKLRLSSDESTLMIEGVRLPTPAQISKMQGVVAEHLEQLALRAPERFAHLGGVSGMSKPAFLKVSHGYFGKFAETFSIPDDVAVEDISASYDDGKVEVVLPKKRPALAYMPPSPAAFLRQNRFTGTPFWNLVSADDVCL